MIAAESSLASESGWMDLYIVQYRTSGVWLHAAGLAGGPICMSRGQADELAKTLRSYVAAENSRLQVRVLAVHVPFQVVG